MEKNMGSWKKASQKASGIYYCKSCCFRPQLCTLSCSTWYSVLQYPVPITVPSTQYCCVRYSVSSYLVLCITVPGTQYCTVLSITVPGTHYCNTQYSALLYLVFSITVPDTQFCSTQYLAMLYPALSITVSGILYCSTQYSVLQYPLLQ